MRGGHNDDWRSGEERRTSQDRRRGGDRRGSPDHQSLSSEPRPYVFREFRERRGSQDRRLCWSDGQPWDRRNDAGGWGAATDTMIQGDLQLTAEEISFLLAQPDP